jgi:hypothetical protein
MQNFTQKFVAGVTTRDECQAMLPVHRANDFSP